MEHMIIENLFSIQSLVYIIASSMIAIMFAELSGVPDFIKKLLLPVWHKKQPNGKKWARRIKPLDCATCLSFWTCLYFTYGKMELIESIALSSTAMVLTAFLMKKYNEPNRI